MLNFTYYLVIGIFVALALIWLGVIPVGAAGVEKVVICHVPPGNPDNAHTIEIGLPAVPAHLTHGDTLGACATPEPTLTEASSMPTPTATPTLHGSHYSEVSSIAVIPAVSLPSTGAEVQESGVSLVWPLLFVGILSSGMALVARRHR